MIKIRFTFDECRLIIRALILLHKEQNDSKVFDLLRKIQIAIDLKI